MKKQFILLVALLFGLTACQHEKTRVEPKITYTPHNKLIQKLPTPFEQLSNTEKESDFGKELLIANSFAKELDLYRAITSYKRALVLAPEEFKDRRLQIEYNILFCYYLGKKYDDVVENFENSNLMHVGNNFPAYQPLLVMLYDSYQKRKDLAKAQSILELLKVFYPETAKQLQAYNDINQGNMQFVATNFDNLELKKQAQEINSLFEKNKKSERKAKLYSAALPGSGYLYVGQKKSALTSFLINTLFIAAAYRFFEEGYTAAGIITTSLEAGWYFGGINGSKLAVREYNTALYNSCGKELMIRGKLFPLLTMQYFF